MNIPRHPIGFRAGLVAIGLFPVAVSPLSAETFVAASQGFAAVAFDSGGILAYGSPQWQNPTPVLAGGNWRSLSADDNRWLVVDANGRLLLGTSFTTAPALFGTDTDWKLASIGWNVSAAVKTDGSLWAWDGFPGAVGGPATSATPLRVGDGNDWKEVVCGRYFRLALKTDGSLWAWGWNNHGSVGDGTNVHRESPVRVGSDNDWTSISCVGFTSFGVKTDGSLWSWGTFSSNFAAAPAPWAPGRVGSDTNWSRVAMNPRGFVCLALKTDGSLWSWGENLSGQLGHGDTTTRTHPTRVGTETGWKHMHASEDHCIAMKDDGSIWQWGKRVGTSDILSSNVPVDRSAFYSREPRLRLPDFTGFTNTWAWPGHVTGEDATRPLQIFNDGIEPLVVHSLSLPPPFTSGPLPAPIPGLSSGTLV